MGLSQDGLPVWQPVDAARPCRLILEIEGYNSLFHFSVRIRECRDGRAVTDWPSTLYRVRHRAHRRVTGAGCWLLFGGSEWVVRDVSFGGVSVWIPPGVYAPQEAPQAAELLTAGGTTIPLVLWSRHQSSCAGSPFAGFAAEPMGELARLRWREFVGRLMHTRTCAGAAWADGCWALYEAAGYFSLSDRTPDEFTPLREAYRSAAACLEDAPHLGCHVAWPAPDRSVFAALSVLRVYDGSWFGFQMAKRKGDAPDGTLAGEVLRDIHLHAYEHAQMAGNCRWVIGFCQDKPIWSRAAHHDFVASLPGDVGSITRFRALRYPAALPPETGFKVGPARPAEVLLFLHVIGTTRPRAYCEALDLVPGRFELEGIAGLWATAGLHRARSVLAARRGGTTVAVAVLEAGEPGLHVYDLLDTVRLYQLAPGGRAAFGALLASAAGWYRALGRAHFVALLEDDLTPPAGAVDLGVADMTIHSADRLPDLLEHVTRITVPRERDRGELA